MLFVFSKDSPCHASNILLREGFCLPVCLTRVTLTEDAVIRALLELPDYEASSMDEQSKFGNLTFNCFVVISLCQWCEGSLCRSGMWNLHREALVGPCWSRWKMRQQP